MWHCHHSEYAILHEVSEPRQHHACIHSIKVCNKGARIGETAWPRSDALRDDGSYYRSFEDELCSGSTEEGPEVWGNDFLCLTPTLCSNRLQEPLHHFCQRRQDRSEHFGTDISEILNFCKNKMALLHRPNVRASLQLLPPEHYPVHSSWSS